MTRLLRILAEALPLLICLAFWLAPWPARAATADVSDSLPVIVLFAGAALSIAAIVINRRPAP